MAKVSTREIIEKLEEYEKIHGVGTVAVIAFVCSVDKTIAYKLYIMNDSDEETVIEIPYINDDELFKLKEVLD